VLDKHQTFAKKKKIYTRIGYHQKLNYNRKVMRSEVNFHVSCWSIPGTQPVFPHSFHSMLQLRLTRIIYWYHYRASSTIKLRYIHISILHCSFYHNYTKISKITNIIWKKILMYHRWYTTSIALMVQKYITRINLLLVRFRASSSIKLNYIHITLQFLSQLY